MREHLVLRAALIAVSIALTPTAWGQVPGAAPAANGAGSPPEEIQFPAPFGRTIVVGGGGRYLVTSLPDAKKVVIFDVAQRKILHEIPAADDYITFAAGATKLVVGLGKKSMLQRYDLATGKLEKSVPYKRAAPNNQGIGISMLAMGSASEGPLMVGCNEALHTVDIQLLDLTTLTEAKLKISGESRKEFSVIANVTPDGQVFSGMSGGRYILKITGSEAKYVYQHGATGDTTPPADGSMILTAAGATTIAGEPIAEEWLPNHDYRLIGLFPAPSGPYYLRYVKANPEKHEDREALMVLHVRGKSSPIAVLKELSLPYLNPQQRRWIYLPDALVEYFPGSNRIKIHRFVIDEVLAKLEVDYLFVASIPPAAVDVGTKFDYQIEAKSKRPGLSYTLTAGPSDMTVSSTGLVSWTAPAAGSPPVAVAIAVADEHGQRWVHRFKLAITGPTKPTAADSADAANGPKQKPRTWTSRDGKFTVEATFVSFDATKRIVSLLRADQTKLDVTLGQLSAADGEFVTAAAAATTPEPAATPTDMTTTVTSTTPTTKLPAGTPVAVGPASDLASLKLPAPIDDLHLGAGGDVAVVVLGEPKQIAIIDLVARKIVKMIPIEGEFVRVAAGQTKFVVYEQKRATLSRYSLATGERELTVSVGDTKVDRLSMGAASEGPIVLVSPGYSQGQHGILDLATLRLTALPAVEPLRYLHAIDEAGRVSGDGGTISSRRAFFSLRAARPSEFGDKTYDFKEALPTSDGRFLCVGAMFVTRRGEPVTENTEQRNFDAALVPAVSGPLALLVPFTQSEKKTATLKLYVQGRPKPLAQIPDFPQPIEFYPPNEYKKPDSRETLRYEQRVMFIPKRDVVVVLAQTKDELQFHKLVMADVLAAAKVEEPVVTSSPPLLVNFGSDFSYKIETAGKSAGLKYAFAVDADGKPTAPEGMTLSPERVVAWKVPEKPKATTVQVDIRITDAAGRETTHAFELLLAKPD